MPTYDQQKLDAELSRDEGRRANIYIDTVGIQTVGIGHNLKAGPLPGQTYPMTDAEIDAVFARDVASTVAKLDAHLSWWRSLDDVRQRVMINMCFNLGIGGLMTFTTFLGMVEHGQYADAANDMLNTLWRRQVGDRAVRLATMMRAGTTPALSTLAPGARPSAPQAPAPSFWQALIAALVSLFNRKV